MQNSLLAPNDLGEGLRAVTEHRVRRRAFRDSRSTNHTLLGINMIAVAISFASLEVAYVSPWSNDTHTVADTGCDGSAQYDQSYTLPMCASNLCLTILSWVILCQYYHEKYTAQCRALTTRDPLGGGGEVAPPFWRGHMFRGFLCELVALGLQPAPWLPALWYEVMSLAVSVRFYLLLRALKDWSKESTQLDTVRGGVFALPLSWRISFKLLYYRHPLVWISATFAFSFTMLSFLLHIAERDCSRDFEDFGNACWLIIVTMTTVGYGDFIPTDPLGRTIAAVACIWGIILLALVCLVITDHLSLNASEARLLRLLQDREMGREESVAAATLIQQVVRTRLPPRRAADANSGDGGTSAETVASLQAQAEASAEAASASRTSRLTLLHRVQKQRESRLLFSLEQQPDDLIMSRLDTLERSIAHDFDELRRAQAAQAEMLGALMRKLGASAEAT